MKQNITPSILNVGVDDTTEHYFENQYDLPQGMSYNSYLIMDNDIAVLDSVEHGKADQWLRQIDESTGGRSPRYLIVHHMEPDHSASILAAMNRWPLLTVAGSAKAMSMLPQFFPDVDFTGRTLSLNEGDTLMLGTHTLTFYNAPMVHWPEVMVSHESAEGILFSADAFGKFGALEATAAEPWTPEARRYYCNIVGKYGPQVTALLNKVSALDIHMIAPLHGPTLTGAAMEEAQRLYRLWSAYKPETNGVLVAYATIYGGTREAAMLLTDMLGQRGIDVRVIELRPGDLSEAVGQAFRYSAVALAAPTYDANIFPPMFDFLHHLQIKGWRSRTVAIIENGSWAPVAGRQMAEMLGHCRDINIIGPTVSIRSRLNASTTASLELLAELLAEAVIAE